VDDRLFLGHLDALDLFEFLDPRLHLLGLGGLIPEPLMNASRCSMRSLLVAVCGHELLAPLVFLL
jgi:hypothetical protein